MFISFMSKSWLAMGLLGFVVWFLTGCGSALGGGPLLPAQASSYAQVSGFTPVPPGPPERAAQASVQPMAGVTRDSQSCALTAGWNTLSFPFDNVTATEGFVYRLYRYNGSGYVEVDPNTHPEQIDGNSGYWAYADSSAEISVSGDWSGTAHTTTLTQGWNFFAFPLRSNRSFTGVGMSYAGQTRTLAGATGFDTQNGAGAWAYARIYSYSDNTWIQMTTNQPDNQFQPWHGYWLWSWVEGALLDFTYTPSPPGLPPSVDSLSPASGPVHTLATINGNNFGAAQGLSTVIFNGFTAGNATSWNNTRIVIAVPAGAATGPVVVTVNGQMSNADKIFTVTTLPHIDYVNPAYGSWGVPVTLNGNNFGSNQGSSVVTFTGSEAGTCALWSNTAIVCTVPGGAVSGPVLVTVNGQASNLVDFYVIVTQYYVSVTTGDDGNNGSLQHPFKTVKQALSIAKSGDTIRVAAGTYSGASGEVFPIPVKSGVKLWGGYNSGFTQWDTTLYPAVMDAGQANRVVSLINVNSGTELKGFTLTHGLAPGGEYGGGLYCSNGNPAISHCLITGNHADAGGAGMYLDRFAPTLSNCAITANDSSGGGGGGIFCNNASAPVITACTLNDNTAYGYGAGLLCKNASAPSLTDCTIADNITSMGAGAGVACELTSHPTLVECIITRNRATSTDWSGGGGLYLDDSSYPNLAGCDITWNSAMEGGGVYSKSIASPSIANCNISNNTATWGAGMYFRHSNINLSDSSICDNISNEAGGGIICHEAQYSPQIIRCSIQDNMTINSDGGGIYCDQDAAPVIRGCTILGNTAAGGGGGIKIYSNYTGIIDCVISGNRAVTQSGGGIQYDTPYGDITYFTLTNCLITGNRAYDGGGVRVSRNPLRLTLQNCTIASNSADNSGGGIYDECPLTMISCLIANNSVVSGTGGGIYADRYSAPTITYCDFYANSPSDAYKYETGNGSIANFAAWGWDGTGCLAFNPLFVDVPNGDYHLQAGSPGIDAGDPAYSGYLLDGSWETQAGTPDVTPLDMGYHYPYTRP